MAVKRPRMSMRQPSRPSFVRVPARRQRRLSDEVRVAFHKACDEGAIEIAKRLLDHLDELIHCPPILPTGIDRRQPESLTALSERLSNLLLRHN